MASPALQIFNHEMKNKIINEGFALLEDPGIIGQNLDVL